MSKSLGARKPLVIWLCFILLISILTISAYAASEPIEYTIEDAMAEEEVGTYNDLPIFKASLASNVTGFHFNVTSTYDNVFAGFDKETSGGSIGLNHYEAPLTPDDNNYVIAKNAFESNRDLFADMFTINEDADYSVYTLEYAVPPFLGGGYKGYLVVEWVPPVVEPNPFGVTVEGNVASDINAPATAAEFEPYTFTLTKPLGYAIYTYDITATVGGEQVELTENSEGYGVGQNYTITYTILGDYVTDDIEITANRTAPYSFPGGETIEKTWSGQLYAVVSVPAGSESIVVSRDSDGFLGLYGGQYNDQYVAAPDTGWTKGTPWTEASYDSDTGCFTVPLSLLKNGGSMASQLQVSNNDCVY